MLLKNISAVLLAILIPILGLAIGYAVVKDSSFEIIIWSMVLGGVTGCWFSHRVVAKLTTSPFINWNRPKKTQPVPTDIFNS